MCNNPNLELVSSNAHPNLVKLNQFVLNILSGNDFQIPTSIKGHNSVINLWNLTRNNPNLDLVNTNAYANFGQLPFICVQDIERKQNSDINQGPFLCYKFAKIDV